MAQLGALLDVDRRRKGPLHRQIYDGLRGAILDGALRAGQPLPSTRSLAVELGDGFGRVVYIGTFSKVLFPALRVGYLIVPPSLWDAFIAARETLDLFSPTLYQLALTEFIAEGHFARRLRRMRGVYLRRRAALLEGLDAHCANFLTAHNADAGLHIATLLGRHGSEVEVVRRLSGRGLVAAALSSCYIGRVREQGLLLGFGGTDETDLRRATRILGEVLRSVRSR